MDAYTMEEKAEADQQVESALNGLKVVVENYPELKQAYLKDDSQEAKHTFKYLLELRNKQKK